MPLPLPHSANFLYENETVFFI